MTELRAVFRRSALSGDADRQILLAHPDALELSDIAVMQGRTRVALDAGHIIGFATWADSAGAIEIEDLFVDPPWMGRGAGRALTEDLIRHARGRGARRVEVTANQQAVGFYSRLGFVASQQVQTRFGPAPRMHLELSP